MFAPDQPYNDLPDLPPAVALETTPILKAVSLASRALGELKGRTHTIPNPEILLNTIALQEAKASSEIENIFTTNDELYRGLTLDALGLTPHAKEVLHYREALWAGTRSLQERPVFSTNLFIQIADTIKENTAGIRKLTGTRIERPATGEIIYTPPAGEDIIRAKLGNLERFCNDSQLDLDPLIRLALMHYQFEAIHPFYDGNGRAGRILLILFLLVTGLLDQPILFLSRFIIENKNDYYRLLRGVTERGEWEPWVLYIVRAIEVTARQTTEKINAIFELLATTLEQARKAVPGRASSKELIELIFEQPYCKIQFVENAGIAKRLTATGYLRELEAAGFLHSVKRGKELFFVNRSLWKLLTDEPLPR